MQLHKVPHISLNADVIFDKPNTKRDLEVLLRIYKSPYESLSEDFIYSPLLKKDTVYILNDDYNDRIDIVNTLYSSLPRSSIRLYISYDFTFVPVNFDYSVDNEFAFIGQMLEESLKGTNLSLELLISHFNQFANKAGTKYKDEHFHCLIGNAALSKTEFDYEMNIFLENLKKNEIINKVIVKE